MIIYMKHTLDWIYTQHNEYLLQQNPKLQELTLPSGRKYYKIIAL